jgi:hypothetical protein
LRSIRVIFRPARRDVNSLRTLFVPGLLWRRMMRRAFGPCRTSTSLMRFPTTSFSRSRRMTSTSGSSIYAPLPAELLEARSSGRSPACSRE